MLPWLVFYEERSNRSRPQLAGQLTVSGIVGGSASWGQIGYWIDERLAGRGIIPTAVALAVDYCFQVMSLHRIEIAIRPENILLRGNNEAADANSFPARVIEGHFHGTQTTYALETLGHRVEAIELGTVPRFAAQDSIRVVIPPDHSWVFPQHA